MWLKAGDKRRLVRTIRLDNATSVWTLPKDTVVEIQQVDEGNRKVLVDNVWVTADWFEGASVLIP